MNKFKPPKDKFKPLKVRAPKVTAPSTQRMDTPAGKTPNRKLEKGQVRYLALEGGGGKGFAFLGAATALEELGVMEQVQGFGGASAGAIFSLLLSIGYTSEMIEQFMKDTQFDLFFDPPTPRLLPRVGTSYEKVTEDSTDEKKLLKRLDLLPYAGPGGAYILTQVCPALPVLVSYLLIGNLSVLQGVKKWMKENESKPPFNLLFGRDEKGQQNWKRYLAYMGQDMGLFAGEYARDVFHEEIVKGIMASGKPVPQDLTRVTFGQHHDYFDKELLITGTNLSTGRTQLFSHRTTAEFPVADAVRISMSLPFLYKPYVIRENRMDWPECGTYVDGGVWNNLPFREFDGDAADRTSPNGSGASDANSNSRSQPRTLGLRLEFEPSEPVKTLGEFAKRYLKFGLAGSGETQVLSKYVDQMIHLDTDGLDLINFTPEPKERDRVIRRARRKTYEYFGKSPPQEALNMEQVLADADDDVKSKERYEKTKPCREEATAPSTRGLR